MERKNFPGSFAGLSRVKASVALKENAGFLLIVLILNFIFLLPPSRQALALTSGSVTATVRITVCGNGLKETGEQCDGSDLNSQTCVSRGYSSGVLSCTSACDFNASACTSSAPASGGGGGGGGGGAVYAPPQPVTTSVTFTGRAYPGSTVTLLKDAQVATAVEAGTNASFYISLSNLSGGDYIFSLYSEDNKGNRSSLLTFPVSVTAGVTTNVSGIFIAPTIAVDKSEVKRGENLAIFGQSAPNGEVTIAVNSENDFFAKTVADKNGAYLYSLDTSQLDIGQHITKAKAALAGDISSFSKAVGFAVGTQTVLAKPATAPPKGELNGDGKVNLVDFSIMAYWFNKPSPPKSVDLNGDGKINLIDFSIMAANWSG